MQSVVNPMCFRVSHGIKYVVFILLVTFSRCYNATFCCCYNAQIIMCDVIVSLRGVDVRRGFLRLRGVDVRRGFLSHLIKEFSQKQMALFADDNIQTEEELSEALFGAIEESLISLVIFSENYASSRWCLLELEKILECRRKNGQIVMPIFYEVDPSEVPHQRRTYGEAFVKHERKYSLTTVQSWRSALPESANLSGFHSSTFHDTLQSNYDVFVSFRGEDVREGFLSHLIEALSQNQIASFVDYNIPKGHQISHALLRAIEVSSIYLIIFSENYASSSWCLLELVKIVECSKKYGHMLVPIFYKVDPSDVRDQSGSYVEAFVAHERQYNLTTLQTWRFALKESANVAGFHSSTFRDDAMLVKEIVKCVSSIVLNLRCQFNSNEP